MCSRVYEGEFGNLALDQRLLLLSYRRAGVSSFSFSTAGQYPPPLCPFVRLTFVIFTSARFVYFVRVPLLMTPTARPHKLLLGNLIGTDGKLQPVGEIGFAKNTFTATTPETARPLNLWSPWTLSHEH